MGKKKETDEDKIINAHCEMVADAMQRFYESDRFYRHTLAELSIYIHNKEITEPIKDIKSFVYRASVDDEYNFLDCLLKDCINDFCKNLKIKLCKDCGKAFIPLNKTAEYCDFPSPHNPMVTCKYYNSQYGLSPAAKLYRTIYMKKSVRAKRHGKNSPEDVKFQKWYEEATKVKNDYNKGIISEDDFILWLVKNDN